MLSIKKAFGKLNFIVQTIEGLFIHMN